jgi:hypothetical protein
MEEFRRLREGHSVGLFNMESVWLKGSLGRKGSFGSHSEERHDAKPCESPFPGKKPVRTH